MLDFSLTEEQKALRKHEGAGCVQQMISQVTEFLRKRGISKIEDLIGRTLQYLPQETFSFWYR